MFKTLTWEEFLENAKQFVELSTKLNDSWVLVENNSVEGNSYLKYEQKLKCINFEKTTTSNFDKDDLVENFEYDDPATSSKNNEAEIVHLEYHVVYSISYQVPVLYFKGFTNDGSLISLENSWKIFTDSSEANYTKSEMLSILTQMDHPVLFKPFLALHPCKTSEILANTPQSKNFIITFLSVMGSFVRLNLNNNYALELEN